MNKQQEKDMSSNIAKMDVMYLGIDPGKKGGMAWGTAAFPEKIFAKKMPSAFTGKATGQDIPGNFTLMREDFRYIRDMAGRLGFQLVAVVELQTARQPSRFAGKDGNIQQGSNTKASFAQGGHYYELLAALTAEKINTFTKTASQWQKVLGSFDKDKAVRKAQIQKMGLMRYPDKIMPLGHTITLNVSDAVGIVMASIKEGWLK